MRAVAAVPTEGKRFLTHENKPPLSSKMKSRGKLGKHNCKYDNDAFFAPTHLEETPGKMIADYNWSTENVPIS